MSMNNLQDISWKEIQDIRSAHLKNPKYIAASVHAVVKFENIGSFKEAKEHNYSNLKLGILKSRVKSQVIADRLPKRTVLDATMGVALLNDIEIKKVADIVAAERGGIGNPVTIQFNSIKTGMAAAYGSLNYQATRNGIRFERSPDPIINVNAIIFDGLDEFEKALNRRSWLERIRQAIGIDAKLLPLARKADITAEFSFSLHGPKELLEKYLADFEAIKNTNGKITYFKALFYPSMFKADFKADPYVPWEKKVEDREPLPVLGEKLLQKFSDVGSAIKQNDARAAFEAAHSLIYFARMDSDIARLLRTTSLARGSGWQYASSNGRVVRHLREKVRNLEKKADTKGLCDLFFEIDCSNKGILAVISENLRWSFDSKKGADTYGTSITRVFGSPTLGILHLSAFDVEEKGAQPERLRLLDLEYASSESAFSDMFETEDDSDSQAPLSCKKPF